MAEKQDRFTPDEDRYIGGRDLTRWKTPVGRFMAKWIRILARWIGPNWVLVLTLVVGVGLAVSLSALSGQVYEAVTESNGVAALDEPALDAAISLRSPELNAAVTAFTRLGGPVGMTIIAIAATGILSYMHRGWTPLVLMVIAAGGSVLMTIAGKEAVGRMRPAFEDAVAPFVGSPAFPSGHSLNSIVIAGVVTYLLMLREQRKRTRMVTIALAVLFTIAMGLSRVYLGHHWLTDVLVAWTLGLAWLAVVITTHRLLLTLGDRRRTAGRDQRP